MKGAKIFTKVFYSAMKNFGKKEKGVSFSGLNVILFLSPDRMSSGNDVTSDKVNFRSDIRQNFFGKNQDIKSFCGSENILELLYLDKYQT